MTKDKMFQLNVHIPMEMNEQLKQISKKKGITKSELIRRYLKSEIEMELGTPRGVTDDEFKEVETAYDSITVDLEKRVEKLEEKEEKSWIRRKLNL